MEKYEDFAYILNGKFLLLSADEEVSYKEGWWMANQTDKKPLEELKRLAKKRENIRKYNCGYPVQTISPTSSATKK